MLTVKMLTDKSLVMTTPARLYQRQSLVDNMQILINPKYSEDIDLSNFDATIEYIDPANIAHMEQLVKDEELYKDMFMRFTMNLDSHFTYMAGEVLMKLTLTYVDSAENVKYILRTGELKIPILKLNDYFAYVDDSSISTLDNKIMELQTKADELAAVAEIYSAKLPDDLTMNDDALLQLSVNGAAIGEGVQLASPVDEDDDKEDGVIDLDSVNPDEDDSVAVIDL